MPSCAGRSTPGPRRRSARRSSAPTTAWPPPPRTACPPPAPPRNPPCSLSRNHTEFSEVVTMRPRTMVFPAAGVGVAAVLLLGGRPAVGQAPAKAPRSGGVLTLAQREETPQGFAIHETSTVST